MGSLWDWKISHEFVKYFPIFVETGYGTGNGLERVAPHPFQKIYSVEIWPDAVVHGREKFAHDPRVSIIHDHSPYGLANIIETEHAPIFFWLDAHFPGADCFGEPFDRAYIPTRLPLLHELETIRAASRERARNYTILIDDLHYYADLPWEYPLSEGASRAAIPATMRSLSFLQPFFGTHEVQVFLNKAGSALLSPIGAPRLRLIG